jgi:hypothetical protein
MGTVLVNTGGMDTVVGARVVRAANAYPLANALGLPFFPITPTFPWLGLLGMIPLPVRCWL